MKYRKKPVVIDAMLYDGTNANAIREWSSGRALQCTTYDKRVTIHTLEGDMFGNVGDYIIKGVANEFYPCKAEIFHATYEKVDE